MCTAPSSLIGIVVCCAWSPFPPTAQAHRCMPMSTEACWPWPTSPDGLKQSWEPCWAGRNVWKRTLNQTVHLFWLSGASPCPKYAVVR